MHRALGYPGLALSCTFLAGSLGCATGKPKLATQPVPAAAHSDSFPSPTQTPTQAQRGTSPVRTVSATGQATMSHSRVESLAEIEELALAGNPAVRRMREEAASEWARAGYARKLPDPTVSSMFYLPPMNFEPDRQVAEVQVMQMLPWLGRLNAEAQRAHLEALAAENLLRAEQLRVIGELRGTWARRYVIGKQIAITEAEMAQLESLVATANARVAAGDAQPGDVLMGTLEWSSLQEQLLSYRQQLFSTQVELNRMVGRDATTPVAVPEQIEATLPPWDHDQLRAAAMKDHPELTAARLRTAATLCGLEVARLKRRPDISLGGGWVSMDAPTATTADAGRDVWTMGISTSLPIWGKKNEAMVSEAWHQHRAANAGEEEVKQRIDAALRDLWEQALAAQRTVELYERSILPQARQTYEADQKSLINNTVTFDRVIRDYRTLLNLELGYHRAVGQLATTLARIRQTVAVDELPAAGLEPRFESTK
ncbi:MAG: TolC family protein [Planctomycetes bacterium]|nr:TolC family protein [Planctomycetota bacterium]